MSLQEGGLSLKVSELSATYQNNDMVIFATLNLPLANGATINTVWQYRSLSENNPLSHPTSCNNIRSISTLNLVSGASSCAYVIDVAGWATELKLGGESPGIQFTAHRAIGIALFCLATVFALFLRPKPKHKYRVYWNIYHHTIGYTVIILAVVNIFKGLDILSPDVQCRIAYTAIIVALGIVAAVLEAFTWYVIIKRGKAEESAKTAQLGNAGQSQYA
ncbi:unnamed protein product [Microthlaspi erraticum]|uniref:Cytochrome b561 domain-containing protein n=1 Tax=Microthlaspi erraticum TaxID=1685480 RepID=A0A6D2JKD6_9BRAS|nr:unnamed protein product [Microthlaspi erraticum]